MPFLQDVYFRLLERCPQPPPPRYRSGEERKFYKKVRDALTIEEICRHHESLTVVQAVAYEWAMDLGLLDVRAQPEVELEPVLVPRTKAAAAKPGASGWSYKRPAAGATQPAKAAGATQPAKAAGTTQPKKRPSAAAAAVPSQMLKKRPAAAAAVADPKRRSVGRPPKPAALGGSSALRLDGVPGTIVPAEDCLTAVAEPAGISAVLGSSSRYD